jgi:hypothetical protein
MLRPLARHRRSGEALSMFHACQRVEQWRDI